MNQSKIIIVVAVIVVLVIIGAWWWGSRGETPTGPSSERILSPEEIGSGTAAQPESQDRPTISTERVENPPIPTNVAPY